ncbi:MAG TPA: hypothetical protein VK983_04975 [Candidatus Limnocylindrales bacterium]|nr:hypothetical protein [Candidatus Limnocylindrales bacterium]
MKRYSPNQLWTAPNRNCGSIAVFGGLTNVESLQGVPYLLV